MRPEVVDGATAQGLESAAASASATRLRVWRLKVSLAPLAQVSTLAHLELSDPSTLEGLEQLEQITSLTIYHFPHIRSLVPVGALTGLRTLHLSTPPSYDASRKCFEVESLAPLGKLTSLDSLVMRGVLPDVGRLEPLYTLTQLRRLEVTHVYAFGLADYAQLARRLPNADGHCLVPYFSAAWTGRCKKCDSERVALTGAPPRSPRLLCPQCNRERLEKHIAAWNAVVTGV